MIKPLFCLLAILFCLSSVNAQYVNIPDSAFRSQLKLKYPGCFNGAGQMDTSCSSIVNETWLNISPNFSPGYINIQGISTIYGIKYFKNLRYLYIDGLSNFIDEWPHKLTFIRLTNVSMDTFTTSFPSTLDTFDCWPAAGGVTVVTLPPFPPTLRYFRLGAAWNLATLPALPASLKHLELLISKLSSLPTLPSGLDYLQCAASLLRTLPALPAGLKYLDCAANRLDSLPALPNSLQTLNANDNPVLRRLPQLPAGLQYLQCARDSILAALPPLPYTLKELSVNATRITCLPVLPDNLEKLYFDRSITKCIPNMNNNIVAQYASNWQGLPKLCNATNNVDNCTAYPVIAGRAFYDANSNDVKDADEFYKPNNKISLSNGNITFTNDSGYYEIGTTAWGTYTVTPSNTFFNISPASKSFTFTSFDTTVYQNFAYQPTATALDSMEMNLSPMFAWVVKPARPYGYWMNVRNVGSTNFGATVIKVTYDNNRLTYDSASNHSVVQSGNSLTLNLPALPIGATVPLQVYFTAKTTIVAGDTVRGKVTVTSGTKTLTDSTWAETVTAFDPNDKTGTPKLTPAQVAGGSYIDYYVRYQNTGTDTAFNVVVTDTLSAQLQPNTLEMIATSHDTRTTIRGNAVSFEMRNIGLPHSSKNELKSHGFIRFKIKPKATLVAGDTIKNKAAIYFDFNTPVITSDALTLIKNEGVVPLRLIRFTGNKTSDNNIHLEWFTANEINTKEFVIEQSTNGRTFTIVGETRAIGRGNNHYDFIIEHASFVDIYFRLKMVDKDAAFNYSPLVVIKAVKANGAFVLNENPVSNEIKLAAISPSLFNTEAVLVDNIGVIVKRFTIRGATQIINVENLPAGLYYLRTVRGSEKVVKGR